MLTLARAVAHLAMSIIVVFYINGMQRDYAASFISLKAPQGERDGSVVECLTRDRRAAGSSLTGVVSLSKNINPSLVLVQLRKTHPY